MKKSLCSIIVFTWYGYAGHDNSGFIHEDKIVKDTAYQYEWTDNEDSTNTPKTWKEAINYCEDLSLAGKSDWHLPNFNELYSIVNRDNHTVITNDGVEVYKSSIFDVFEYKNTQSFWSSTSVAHFEHQAWTIDFYTGDDHRNNKFYKAYVRCIRTYE